MPRNRKHTELIDPTTLEHDVMTTLEEILGLGLINSAVTTPNSGAPKWTLGELRDLLCATVEKLESDAARLRQQLEQLDLGPEPIVYH